MMYKHKKKIISIFLVLFLLPFSCITRLSRPQLTGRVVDYQDKPIENCIVGETKTDHNGYFHLPAITRKVFFIPEIFYMEAPPLLVSETVQKQGYQQEQIEMFHRYGGGLSKNTNWQLGDIYLKKNNEKIDFPSYMVGKWKMSLTQSYDTLYLIKEKISEHTYLIKNRDYYAGYERYSDNYLRHSGPNNLPKGIIRKEILLDVLEHTINTKTIIQYGDKEGKNNVPQKENDTIINSGSWQYISPNNLQFDTNMEELNGVYEILKSDKLFLQLKKITKSK